jgi:hypothetical protein
VEKINILLSSQDITSHVTSFSFSDGISTITNVSANSFAFVITTDSNGNITDYNISFEYPDSCFSPLVLDTTGATAAGNCGAGSGPGYFTGSFPLLVKSVPTLSVYGLVSLVLMMLGMGFYVGSSRSGSVS